MCFWLCTASVHNTTQNSSDNLPSYLQTNIIAQMLSIAGEGGDTHIQLHSSDSTQQCNGAKHEWLPSWCLLSSNVRSYNANFIALSVMQNFVSKMLITCCVVDKLHTHTHTHTYTYRFLSGCEEVEHRTSQLVQPHNFPQHRNLSLIHIWRCRRSTLCRSRWSPYH